MIKSIKIIKELKRLKKKPVNQLFLNSLKMKLEVFVDNYPINEKKWVSAHYDLRSIFSLRIIQVPLAVFMVTMFLSASVATASQGSLPGGKLYPIKIFTEDIRSAVTLKSKDKAKLNMSFAAKRIKEIEKILEETEIESDKLEIALNQFEKNLTRATNIIREEKNIANDVDTEVVEIHRNIDENKEGLERIMQEKKVKIEDEEKEIEEKIKKAELKGGEGKDILIDELIEIKINKDILEFKERDVREILEHAEKIEEIKEVRKENNSRREKDDDELESEKKRIENKREVIKKREEAKKEIREKILENIDIDRKEKDGEKEHSEDKKED